MCQFGTRSYNFISLLQPWIRYNCDRYNKVWLYYKYPSAVPKDSAIEQLSLGANVDWLGMVIKSMFISTKKTFFHTFFSTNVHWPTVLFKLCSSMILLTFHGETWNPVSIRLVVAGLRLFGVHSRKNVVRGNSNNTWHFFGTFLTPPPLYVTFYFFKNLFSETSRRWTVKWSKKKVSFKA